MLAEETGGAVHICHISTAKSVALVRRYKRKGVQITCETCPQYFSLTEDEILAQGPGTGEPAPAHQGGRGGHYRGIEGRHH